MNPSLKKTFSVWEGNKRLHEVKYGFRRKGVKCLTRDLISEERFTVKSFEDKCLLWLRHQLDHITLSLVCSYSMLYFNVLRVLSLLEFIRVSFNMIDFLLTVDINVEIIIVLFGLWSLCLRNSITLFCLNLNINK